MDNEEAYQIILGIRKKVRLGEPVLPEDYPDVTISTLNYIAENYRVSWLAKIRKHEKTT